MITLPHKRSGLRLPTRLRWSLPRPGSTFVNAAMTSRAADILEPGLSGHCESGENRITPAGITEQEMLASLNYLDAEGLESFRLVGPVLARHIEEWRNKHHYFSSLDELIAISGIGPAKFRSFVGRDNVISKFPLHSLLKVERTRPIDLADLQPLHRPAAGIDRLYLDRLGSEARHKRAAREKGFKIVLRKTLNMQLIFYLNGTAIEGRAKLLVERLPVLLRRIFKHRNPQTI